MGPFRMRPAVAVLVLGVVLLSGSPAQAAAARAGNEASGSAVEPAVLSVLNSTGVCDVSLLWSYLSKDGSGGYGNRSTAQAEMRSACASGFVYIRFSATPYWPSEMQATYMAKRADYWATFDELVEDAGKAGCQLVPSILWFTFLWSDLAKEPLSALLREGSVSRTMLQNYTTELVSRYRNDDTIAFWELGNELNLMMDLDMAVQNPGIAPSLGTPAKRTQADNISTADGIALYTDMAAWIRGADRHPPRPISTGNSIPRGDAEHLRMSYHLPQRDWSPDTFAQFKTNLLDISSMAEIVSVHFYHPSNVRFNYTNPNGADFLSAIHAIVRDAGKLLYVGEFGQPVSTDPHTPSARPYSVSVYDEVVKDCIPLSSIWVWGYHSSNGDLTPFTIVPGRDDAFIHTMETVNTRMASQCRLD